MLKISLVFCCLLICLSLSGCGSDTEKEGKAQKSATAESKADSGAQPAVSAGKSGSASSAASAALAPLTENERQRAEAVIDFYNAAGTVTDGPYGQYPDELAGRVRKYLKEWRVPTVPRLKAVAREEARRRLSPPAGLLGEAASTAATQALGIMERTLDDMQRDYAALEKYSKDENIQDDGAQGDKLTVRLLEAHADFALALRKWQEAVGAEAASAEDALLREHPLRRQILSSSKVFALFRQAGMLLAADTPDTQALTKVYEELQSTLAEAGKPPFTAAPAVERVYRAFLKKAALFPAALQTGLAEGFHSNIRQNMNTAVTQSREAYNLFVREANQTR